MAALDTTRVYLRHHRFYFEDELIADSGRILPEELQ